MTKDRFQLEGVTYFRKCRTCGKPGCKCQFGELHGPYWYATEHGRVQYLGRTLPEGVTRARAANEAMHEAVDALFRQRLQEAAALGVLLQGGRLMESEREMITALGFRACLVPADPSGLDPQGRRLANIGTGDDEALPAVLAADDDSTRATPAIDDGGEYTDAS